jgi:hypothetical protein
MGRAALIAAGTLALGGVWWWRLRAAARAPALAYDPGWGGGAQGFPSQWELEGWPVATPGELDQGASAPVYARPPRAAPPTEFPSLWELEGWGGAMPGEVDQGAGALAGGAQGGADWNPANVPPPELADVIAGAAEANGLPPALLAALIYRESSYRPAARARGSSARGLAQVTKAAAVDVGVPWETLDDPAAGAEAGARYLRRMLDRFGGDVALALGAYNVGPGDMAAVIAGQPPPSGRSAAAVSQEAGIYAGRIMALA